MQYTREEIRDALATLAALRSLAGDGDAARGDLRKIAGSLSPEELGRLAEELAKGDDGGGQEGERTLSLLDDDPAAPTPDPESAGEYVVEDVLGAVRRLSREARADLLAVVSVSEPPRATDAVRAWLDRWIPRFSATLAEARLAAVLEGMRAVGRRVGDGGVLDPSRLADQLAGASSWGAAHAAEPATRLELVEEAARDLASRHLLTPSEFGSLADAAKEAAAEQTAAERDRVREVVRSAVVDAVTQGTGLDEFRRRLKEGAVSGPLLEPARSEAVFRTSVAQGYSEGQEKLLRDPAVADLFPYRAYWAVSDSRARHEHKEMESRGIGGSNIYRADDPVFQLFRPPWGYNCLLPGTLVQGRFQVGLKSWYAGKVTVIRVRSGYRLAVTSNHPVLTLNGFRPAKEVRQGDRLLRYAAEENRWRDGCVAPHPSAGGPGAEENKQEPPTVAEQVFVSLSQSGGVGFVVVAADDLHGEAKFGNGQVEVVGPYSKLLFNLQPHAGQRIGDFLLSGEHAPSAIVSGLGSSDLSFQRDFSPPLRDATCADGVGHLLAVSFPERSHNFGSVADAEPGVPEGFRQTGRANADGLCKISDGLAGEVAAVDVAQTGDGLAVPVAVRITDVSVTGPELSLRFGPASHLDPAIHECLGQGLVVDAYFARKLTDRLPGVVTLDEVVEVWDEDFRGHVYDFQTETGLIVADGFFVSNCRCSFSPLSVREAARRGVKEAQQWLATGVRPVAPAWVEMPPWRPDKGFERPAVELGTAVEVAVPVVAEAGPCLTPEDAYALAVRLRYEGGDGVKVQQTRDGRLLVILDVAPDDPDFPRWLAFRDRGAPGGVELSSDGGDWSPYRGPNGGRGWKSPDGRVVYQEARPGAGEHDRRPDPKTAAGRKEIAFALRRAVWRASKGDPKDQCINAAHALKLVYPEAEVWSGTYGGEPHTVARVGGRFLDVTADQFGGPRVQVLRSLPGRAEGGSYHRYEHLDWERPNEVEAGAVLREFYRALRESGPKAGSVELSTAAADPWVKYQGPHGGHGWRNAATGEVVYREEKPGGHGGHAADARPAGVKGKALAAAKAVGHGLHRAEEAVLSPPKRFGRWSYGKMPPRVQRLLDGTGKVGAATLKVLFTNFRVVQALSERTARKRGLSEEQAARLQGVLSTIDNKTFEVLKVAAFAGVHAAHLPAYVSATVPVASAAYLAYATADDPLATLRAAAELTKETAVAGLAKVPHDEARILAKQLSRKGTAKSTASFRPSLGGLPSRELATEADGPDAAEAVADFLAPRGWSDWAVAVLSAALDQTGNLPDAAELAGRVLDAHPEDPGEPRDDDEAWAEANGLAESEGQKRELSTDGGDDGGKLARAYADLWNARGEVSDEEVAEAADRLGDDGWELFEEGGRWEPARVEYGDEDGGFSLADDPDPWVQQQGPRGGTFWFNAVTKEKVYRKTKPGGGRRTGPRPPSGGAKRGSSKADPAAVKARISEILQGEVSPEHVEEVRVALEKLTVAQIHEVKKAVSVSASGPKRDLARKVAERALALGKKKEPGGAPKAGGGGWGWGWEETAAKEQPAATSHADRALAGLKKALPHLSDEELAGLVHDPKELLKALRKGSEELPVAQADVTPHPATEPTAPTAEAPESERREPEPGPGSDAGGGGPADGATPEDGGRVEAEAGGPDGAGADQSGDAGGEPAGDAVARSVPASRVPASVPEVNRRIDRFQKFFQAKGQGHVADWLGKLRDHVNAAGGEAALASLGDDLGGGDGGAVQYEGAARTPIWESFGRFTEAYHRRNGITPVIQGEAVPGSEGRLVSSMSSAQGAADQRPSELQYLAGDFTPTDPTFKDKLEEAKHLPGLESSEDLGVIMGAKVTHLTPDTLAKLDEKYGPGQWIVKAYGDEAAAGYGIFFPQRAAQIAQDARNTIWAAGSHLSQYGFRLGRDPDTGRVFGLVHESGDTYQFGTPEFEQTIHGDARHWAEQARAAADNERGAMLPGGGKDFMAQPAFKAVGVSDADRAAGRTIAPGEGRVHIVTRGGKVEVIPHSTWIKGESLPVVFESEETKAMARAALEAISALPESERSGQIYAPDIVKAEGGYRVVEANPANETGSSGYLGDNPFIIDAYTSHLVGRTPAHVRFLRKILEGRGRKAEGAKP